MALDAIQAEALCKALGANRFDSAEEWFTNADVDWVTVRELVIENLTQIIAINIAIGKADPMNAIEATIYTAFTTGYDFARARYEVPVLSANRNTDTPEDK